MQRKPTVSLLSTLANNIRAFRASKGISQDELAELCGLHRTYIGSVERKERNVTLSTLEAIALALDTTVLEILTEKGSDQHQQL